MRWAGCAARWRGARSAGWRPPCRPSRRLPPTTSSPPGASARTTWGGGWGGKPGPFGIMNMPEVRLVDVSLRDGNQSLWGATGLRTDHILQIAPVLNRVGFRALDFMSSTAMGVAVRTHREDPWERIRLTRAAMPDTPLQLIGTGFRFISWERAHPEVMQLVYERLELHAHGTIGLSPLVYLAAPSLGVSVLQTGCGALADGSSLPDAERVVANLRALGHTVDVDDRLLARAARYFSRLAAAEGLPSGRPQPYDEAFTRHQLAGGVLTTLRRQLSELGLEAQFGAVIQEVRH